MQVLQKNSKKAAKIYFKTWPTAEWVPLLNYHCSTSPDIEVHVLLCTWWPWTQLSLALFALFMLHCSQSTCWLPNMNAWLTEYKIYMWNCQLSNLIFFSVTATADLCWNWTYSLLLWFCFDLCAAIINLTWHHNPTTRYIFVGYTS